MNNFDIIEQNIKTRGEISPLLFLGSSGEVFHARLLGYLQNLLKENHIDTQSLFHLEDNGESLKIEEVKKFISSSEMRPRFAFQIFFIENISRMTQQSQNACLKFFEEPGEGNIVILTSQSEAGILETILSRVSVYSVNASQKLTKNEFYYSMILSHAEQSSNECIQYFFSGKYEKSEYIEFLKSLIVYIRDSGNFAHLLDEIHDDMNGIMKNNLQARYIVDKYLMLLDNK